MEHHFECRFAMRPAAHAKVADALATLNAEGTFSASRLRRLLIRTLPQRSMAAADLLLPEEPHLCFEHWSLAKRMLCFSMVLGHSAESFTQAFVKLLFACGVDKLDGTLKADEACFSYEVKDEVLTVSVREGEMRSVCREALVPRPIDRIGTPVQATDIEDILRSLEGKAAYVSIRNHLYIEPDLQEFTLVCCDDDWREEFRQPGWQPAEDALQASLEYAGVELENWSEVLYHSQADRQMTPG